MLPSSWACFQRGVFRPARHIRWLVRWVCGGAVARSDLYSSSKIRTRFEVPRTVCRGECFCPIPMPVRQVRYPHSRHKLRCGTLLLALPKIKNDYNKFRQSVETCLVAHRSLLRKAIHIRGWRVMRETMKQDHQDSRPPGPYKLWFPMRWWRFLAPILITIRLIWPYYAASPILPGQTTAKYQLVSSTMEVRYAPA